MQLLGGGGLSHPWKYSRVVAGVQQHVAAWVAFSLATQLAPSYLSPKQSTEAFCLEARGQAVGTQLAKEFQHLSGLETMSCVVAQATAHETINRGCMEKGTAYNILMSANAPDKKLEKTLRKLHREANQAWKDTNNVVYEHQLRYDLQLAGFIMSTKEMLQAKWDEVWECMQNFVDMEGMPQVTCLCLALQVLKLLPNILLDISFHAPFPMMLAYGPESYSSQAWLENEEETYALGENSRASHILSKKLEWMASRSPSQAHSCNSSVDSSQLH